MNSLLINCRLFKINSYNLTEPWCLPLCWPRAPGQSRAPGLGLGVGCGLPLLAARVPPSPGAGAASVLPPWVWAEGEGAKVHILRRQAQEVRAGTEKLEQVGCKNYIWSLG